MHSRVESACFRLCESDIPTACGCDPPFSSRSVQLQPTIMHKRTLIALFCTFLSLTTARALNIALTIETSNSNWPYYLYVYDHNGNNIGSAYYTDYQDYG